MLMPTRASAPFALPNAVLYALCCCAESEPPRPNTQICSHDPVTSLPMTVYPCGGTGADWLLNATGDVVHPHAATRAPAANIIFIFFIFSVLASPLAQHWWKRGNMTLLLCLSIKWKGVNMIPYSANARKQTMFWPHAQPDRAPLNSLEFLQHDLADLSAEELKPPVVPVEPEPEPHVERLLHVVHRHRDGEVRPHEPGRDVILEHEHRG